MVTKTKPTVTEPKEKKDWLPVVAVGAGVVGAGVGLYLFLKKPAGWKPGSVIKAHYTFDYLGSGGTYVIQTSFGHVIIVSPWFNHIEGLIFTQEIELPSPDSYTFDLDCKLPIGTSPGVYDAESLIRTPEMDQFNYLIKVVTQSAIRVTE